MVFLVIIYFGDIISLIFYSLVYFVRLGFYVIGILEFVFGFFIIFNILIRLLFFGRS